MVLTMAITITQLKITLECNNLIFQLIRKYNLCLLCPLSLNFLQFVFFLSGSTTVHSPGTIIVFSQSWMAESTLTRSFFLPMHASTFPYSLYACVPCVPCVPHPVSCVLCAIHPGRDLPHPPLTLYHSLLLCDTSREWSHLLKLFLLLFLFFLQIIMLL